MKVKDLIGYLEQFDKELEVFVYSDHGQMPQKASVPCVMYLEDANEYMTDEYSTYEGDIKEYGYNSKAILI